jgi:hypothetical protein
MIRKTLTEAEWRELDRLLYDARKALVRAAVLAGKCASVRHADHIIKVVHELDQARSDLGNEMFKGGGPRDTIIIYDDGKVDDVDER